MHGDVIAMQVNIIDGRCCVPLHCHLLCCTATSPCIWKACAALSALCGICICHLICSNHFPLHLEGLCDVVADAACQHCWQMNVLWCCTLWCHLPLHLECVACIEMQCKVVSRSIVVASGKLCGVWLQCAGNFWQTINLQGQKNQHEVRRLMAFGIVNCVVLTFYVARNKK